MFVIDTITEKLKRNRLYITEFAATVMILLIAVLPGMMIFSPSLYGKVFKIFGKIEITVLVAVALFNLCMCYNDIRSYKPEEFIKKIISKFVAVLSLNRQYILLLIAYIISFVSSCLADDIQRAFWGTDFRVDGFFMYSVFAAVFVFGSLIRNPVLKKTVYGMYVFSFILNGMIVAQQYIGVIGTANEASCPPWLGFLKDIYESKGIRTGVYYKGITGAFYNSNHVGYFLAMCSALVSAFFIVSKNKLCKTFFAFLCVVSVWLVIVNNTFGCYIAITVTYVVMAMFYFWRFRKNVSLSRLCYPLTVLVALTVILTFAGNNTVLTNVTTLKKDIGKIAGDNQSADKAGSGRWELWVETADMIQDKPVLGYGPDNVNDEYKSRKLDMTRAHNEYLEHPLNCGIIYAVFYMAGVFYIIFRRIRHMKNIYSLEEYLIPLAVCVCYMVSSFTGVFLFYTACHFFVMLSLLKD